MDTDFLRISSTNPHPGGTLQAGSGPELPAGTYQEDPALVPTLAAPVPGAVCDCHRGNTVGAQC